MVLDIPDAVSYTHLKILSCYCDPGKAAEELGWTAENDIKEMCEGSWRWQKNNPNGCEGEEEFKIYNVVQKKLG